MTTIPPPMLRDALQAASLGIATVLVLDEHDQWLLVLADNLEACDLDGRRVAGWGVVQHGGTFWPEPGFVLPGVEVAA